jgi:hypothetical protein
METQKRIRVSVIAVPAGLIVVIALAALSYFATRATITEGPTFSAAGTRQSGSAFVVEWRTGTDIGIVASFVPSRSVRVRSVTIDGLDPKNAVIASAQYGFWDGRTPLPSFTSESDVLPAEFHPRAFVSAFYAPARSRVFVKLLVRSIADAKVSDLLTGFRVDSESWAWAHTTSIPFQEPVKLEPPSS